MAEETSAAELLAAWARMSRDARALHFIAVVETQFTLGATSLNCGIGPLEIEAWFRDPLWRLETIWNGQREIVVLGDSAHLHCRSAEGTWVRSERLGKVDPIWLKHLYCGLDRLDAVSQLSMGEERSGHESMWVVEGHVADGAWRERRRWWFAKDGLVLRRLELEWTMTFEWRGRRTQMSLTSQSIAYRLWEFPADIRDDLFLVPADAVGEVDTFVEFLEGLANVAAGIG